MSRFNDSDALVNSSGRRSPPTVVRDIEPSRERDIPIRLTGQPANITTTYRTSPASPAERQPFLTGDTYVRGGDPENNNNAGQQPREKLTLIRADDNMADEVEGSGWRAKLAKSTRIRNEYVRDFLAEFLGSFILIVFGNGAVAQVVLSRGETGNFFAINIAYGFAVAFGVYVAGGVSGGHLNPAVTLGFAVLGKLRWLKVPIYMLAQLLGCFIGSAIIYAIYYEAIVAFDGGVRAVNGSLATAGIFASYPKAHLSWSGGLVDQIFGTSFLMLGILALTDDRNMGPHKGVVPILIGLLISAIALSYGYNCGFPINPARDFGPRLFTSIAGWGSDVYTTYGYSVHYWFWIPIVGPLLGGLLGVALYQLFVGNHWAPLQRTGIELQVVRKAQSPEEYELVKAAQIRSGEATVPVSLTTKDAQRFR